jgi:4-aminobutyrate aminotransferase
MGERLAEGISQAVSDSSVIAEMRGRGLMLAIETVVPDSIEPNAQAAGQLMEATRASGLLIGKGGLYGNVIRIAPPMTVTADEIDEGKKKKQLLHIVSKNQRQKLSTLGIYLQAFNENP